MVSTHYPLLPLLLALVLVLACGVTASRFPHYDRLRESCSTTYFEPAPDDVVLANLDQAGLFAEIETALYCYSPPSPPIDWTWSTVCTPRGEPYITLIAAITRHAALATVTLNQPPLRRADMEHNMVVVSPLLLARRIHCVQAFLLISHKPP